MSAPAHIRQSTYLFAWNPTKWPWEALEQDVHKVNQMGQAILPWSCAAHRQIRPGDRVFLVRLGAKPKGIMASGHVVSPPFTAPHWNGEDREVWKVEIAFDVLLNPAADPLLGLKALTTGPLAKQSWTPMSSGVLIRPEAAQELEAVWFRFLTTQALRFPPFVEVVTDRLLYEGGARQVVQTWYERSKHAREQSLQQYGYACAACGFDFEKIYGRLGHQFIHVHHRRMLSTTGQAYQVDPVHDLVPVCPNCHAMLHQENPPLTIEQLQALMQETAGNATP